MQQKNNLWGFLEGSVIDNKVAGDIVRGIMEDNELNYNSFKFFKAYPFFDLHSKQKYLVYVFTCKINLPLLKISLTEVDRLDYMKPSEIKNLPTNDLVKKIIKDELFPDRKE